MNFNANYGGAPPAGGPRKLKRVSDVNALGQPTIPAPQPYAPNPYGAAPESAFVPPGPGSANVNFDPVPGLQTPQQTNMNYSSYNTGTPGPIPYDSYVNPGPAAPFANPAQEPYNPQPRVPGPTAPGAGQFAMFQQPIVQDMALQYGQRLADQGKQLVESHFEKYVPVTRLKYYFAVDSKYVVNKLRLIFFPFTHKDWTVRYDHDNPVQPRFDLNAPDLYIPTMAYITYVVLAGLVLGMQNRFSPEQLGIISSSALAYSIFELIIYSIVLYVTNISTSMKTLDLLAFSGYKFPVIVACISISIIFKRVGYYSTLIYSSFTLFFFLLRTLKAKILHDAQPTAAAYNAYGNGQQNQQYDYTTGRKRKLYFLFLVAGAQPLLSFWLSLHLIPSGEAVTAS